MRPTLEPRLQQSQRLLLSPEVRQGIGLLRMSNLELCAFAAQLAEQNPLLAVEPAAAEAALPEVAPPGRGPSPSQTGKAPPGLDTLPARAEGGLYRHVFAETERLFPPGPDRRLAQALCEGLEPTGWLPAAELQRHAAASPRRAAAVLARLRRIEPAGLFARDLRDCLTLQARRAGEHDAPMRGLLARLPDLAAGRTARLCRQIGCTPEALSERIRRLRRYDPKPGLQLAEAGPVPWAPPDLLVRRRAGAWEVELNGATLPAVRVDPHAESLHGPGPARPFLREWMPQARWLHRAIAQRNATLLRVGAEVMRRQSDFLETGPASLRPLQQRDIAQALNVHESTVSRIVNAVTVETPRGVLPLRGFFSTAIGGEASADSVSATAIRHRIRSLIAAEDSARPLSDDALGRRLASEGIAIARRTVAKYREAEGIAASAQRLRRHRQEAALACP